MDKIDQLSEQIEFAALKSLHDCCPSDTKHSLGLELVDIADGFAACSTGDPSILVNRVLGLGSSDPVTPEALESVLHTYTSRDIENFFLHLYESSITEQAMQLLDGKRFDKRRGWMKFRQENPQAKSAETELRVEQVGLDKSKDFGEIVCVAFGLKEESAPMLAGLANDDRWRLYVSYSGDKPAGAGSLFVDGDCGWFEWGATHPDFRKMGSQGAIMAARLTLANKLGLKFLFTETGEEVDGDPQHSYKNIMKAGFSESVLRFNYAPGS